MSQCPVENMKMFDSQVAQDGTGSLVLDTKVGQFDFMAPPLLETDFARRPINSAQLDSGAFLRKSPNQVSTAPEFPCHTAVPLVSQAEKRRQHATDATLGKSPTQASGIPEFISPKTAPVVNQADDPQQHIIDAVRKLIDGEPGGSGSSLSTSACPLLRGDFQDENQPPCKPDSEEQSMNFEARVRMIRERECKQRLETLLSNLSTGLSNVGYLVAQIWGELPRLKQMGLSDGQVVFPPGCPLSRYQKINKSNDVLQPSRIPPQLNRHSPN